VTALVDAMLGSERVPQVRPAVAALEIGADAA